MSFEIEIVEYGVIDEDEQENPETLCKSVEMSNPPTSNVTAIQAFLHPKLYKIENDSYQIDKQFMSLCGEKENFEEKLKLFKSFPGSANKFRSPLAEPYDTYHHQFFSEQKKMFMYKQDILIQLQEATANTPFDDAENSFIFSVIGFYLKGKEHNLGGKCELVEVSNEMLFEFSESLRKELEDLAESNGNVIDEPLKLLNARDVAEKLKKILPINHNDRNYNSISKLVKLYEKKMPVIDNRIHYTVILNWIELLIQRLEGFITANQPWFQLSARKQDDPILIRVFERYTRKFVMKYETWLLEGKAGERKMKDFKRTLKKVGHYPTMDYEEFLKEFGDSLANVELINIPLRHMTGRREALIPTFDDKYCVMGIDLLLDICQDMVTAQKVFYKIDARNSDKLNEFVQNLQTDFPMSQREVVMICSDKADSIRAKETAFFDQHLRKMPDLILDFEIDRWTFDNFKTVVGVLQLNIPFPHILDVGRHARKCLKKHRKTKLRHKDFWFVLENTQMLCFITISRHINEFLHRQTACNFQQTACGECQQARLDRQKEEKEAVERANVGSEFPENEELLEDDKNGLPCA